MEEIQRESIIMLHFILVEESWGKVNPKKQWENCSNCLTETLPHLKPYHAYEKNLSPTLNQII